MKLNIYEKKKIIKTYEADTYDLMFGTVEDVANAIQLDDLKTGSNEELVIMASKLIMTSLTTVKELFKDIFEGLTDDELKKVKISEMINVLVEVVKFTLEQLSLGVGSKN